MSDAAWQDDSIQFPRLLDEIHAIGMPQDMLEQLCLNMDLEPFEIGEILRRATEAFDKIKATLPPRRVRTPAEYAVDGGQHCPFCGSNNLELPFELNYSNGDRFMYNFNQCLSCGKKWNDVYALTGYEEQTD